MILHRIVERQAETITRELTDDQAEYEFIENLVESTKPEIDPRGWHRLISTPFRYPVPVDPAYQARFKPPFSDKLVFYGSCSLHTAVFEFGYHWLLERVHLVGLSQTIENRNYFTVGFNDPSLKNIRNNPSIKQIMDRRDYSASHSFIANHPEVTSLLYPSARDPQSGDCVAAFKIETLEKKPAQSTVLHLLYREKSKEAYIYDPSGIYPSEVVPWALVA